ncbi:MAG: DUF373 family protein [archaeon]
MKEAKHVLVVCVDRDDDLGKAKVKGPIIGRKDNLNAAARLALIDPEDSDVNSVFAAVKVFEELKNVYSAVEVVTLTGEKKAGFAADQRINNQLDQVLEDFPADGFVLVTDGAEDDQVIPILQSRAKILSKKMVIVKQAKEVESMFYTVKNALKDPFLGIIAFGIPGLIMVLYAVFGAMSFQIIAMVLGAYLLIKGLGIEDFAFNWFRSVRKTISIQRTSFPFYIASIFLFAFAFITGYQSFLLSTETDFILLIVASARTTFLFFALSAIAFLVGKGVDAVHFNKAFYLRNHILSAVSVLMVWVILDAGIMVFLGNADLQWFVLNVIGSFIILIITYKLSAVLDVRKKITNLLIGLPVYNNNGKWLGKITNINKQTGTIEFQEKKKKKLTIKARKKEFILMEGRIVLH